MHYRERLLPKWWVYLFLAALIAMLSIAYGAAISAAVGWIMFVVITALVFIGITTSAPLIEVNGALRVDRARLPLQCVGSVRALDAEATRAARSSRDHALDYVLVKMWSSTTAVWIEVVDDDDPHTGWLISTRHPDALRTAIDAGRHAGGEGLRASDTV